MEHPDQGTRIKLRFHECFQNNPSSFSTHVTGQPR